MPFAVVERPSLFLTRRVGEAAEHDMAATLEHIRALMAASPTSCAVVYDAGHDPNGRPGPRARQLAATWFGDNEALLRRRCAGMDFAFPSPLSRGVLTAILWLKSPPMETAVHGSTLDAVSSAMRRVGAGGSASSLVRALDDAAAKLR